MNLGRAGEKRAGEGGGGLAEGLGGVIRDVIKSPFSQNDPPTHTQLMSRLSCNTDAQKLNRALIGNPYFGFDGNDKNTAVSTFTPKNH